VDGDDNELDRHLAVLAEVVMHAQIVVPGPRKSRLWVPPERRVERAMCMPPGGVSMPLQYGRKVGAPAFLPTSIAGCVLWLRSDLGITIGTGVSAWADQSGSGGSGSQGTAANQPAYAASDANFNGKPSVTYNGTTSYMTGAVALSSTAASFYLVYRPVAAPVAYEGRFSAVATGGNDAVAPANVVIGTRNAGNALCYRGGDGGPIADPGAGVLVGYAARFDGVSCLTKLNGTTGTTASTGAFGTNGWTMGARSTPGINTWCNVGFAEVIVYSGFTSTAADASIRAYIAARYAIVF
jgi:hypothetical protein